MKYSNIFLMNQFLLVFHIKLKFSSYFSYFYINNNKSDFFKQKSDVN